ncbi:MAG TPA: diaminopimelate decarboxylase [Stellaceae bacterium]|nr:diaminopimelate decarboxylase [Stellaceae bacterium]
MNDDAARLALAEGFAYRAGELHAEGIALSRIAAEVGTPFYCYSNAGIASTYRRFAAAVAGEKAQVHYALKANSNLAVIRLLGRLGAGADVVSEGELRRALAAGIPPERIVFSGIGKTAEELAFALGQGIHQINVELIPELELLSAVAVRLGKTAAVALRVNPDVDARTHAKISTGKKENKFGIDIAHAAEAYRLAARLPGIEPVGLAVHIGSQITDLGPFEAAFRRLVELAQELRREGLTVERLDLGGGLGVRYRAEAPPPVEDYAALARRITHNLGFRLAFEPGRAIVANAGVLVSRVLYLKAGVTRRFIVQDAAMNDLIRPSLYEAWHEILPVRAAAPGAVLAAADVVGPICETGDTFATARPLPPIAVGDLLAILSAGAYGAVMSSSYNTRLLAPEVLVNGDEYAVIRPRPSYQELLGQDRIPPWLSGP